VRAQHRAAPENLLERIDVEEAQEETFWRVRVGGDAALVLHGRSAEVRINVQKLCGRFVAADDWHRVTAIAGRLQMAVLQHRGFRVKGAADGGQPL